MKLSTACKERIVRHDNQKDWRHGTPQDPDNYSKRGNFVASTCPEVKFWGRPLDGPQKLKITWPLIGDEAAIERALFRRLVSDEDISVKQRWVLDAKMKRPALAKGHGSIVLMPPKDFTVLRGNGRLPRSIELDILNAR
jgi:hypothetical protein